MHTLNIVYSTGQLVRTPCSESDALREGVQGASRAIAYGLAILAGLCAFIFNIL